MKNLVPEKTKLHLFFFLFFFFYILFSSSVINDIKPKIWLIRSFSDGFARTWPLCRSPYPVNTPNKQFPWFSLSTRFPTGAWSSTKKCINHQEESMARNYEHSCKHTWAAALYDQWNKPLGVIQTVGTTPFRLTIETCTKSPTFKFCFSYYHFLRVKLFFHGPAKSLLSLKGIKSQIFIWWSTPKLSISSFVSFSERTISLKSPMVVNINVASSFLSLQKSITFVIHIQKVWGKGGAVMSFHLQLSASPSKVSVGKVKGRAWLLFVTKKNSSLTEHIKKW